MCVSLCVCVCVCFSLCVCVCVSLCVFVCVCVYCQSALLDSSHVTQCEICEKYRNHLDARPCVASMTHAVIGWQGDGGKGGVCPSHSAAAQWQQAVAVSLHLFSTWSGNCSLLGKQFFFWIGGRESDCTRVYTLLM